MASQAQAGTLDVSKFFDCMDSSRFVVLRIPGTAFRWNTGLVPFQFLLIFLSSLVCFFDGMDFTLVSVALPETQSVLHLTD